MKNVTTEPQSHLNANPTRKSPRAKFHDYSGGEYFITICTEDKAHFFGEIINNEITLSEIGQIAYRQLDTLHTHYQYIEVPLFVVMPNHVHAIIVIQEPSDGQGQMPLSRTALSVVVGGYKQAVTMYARRNNIEFSWQNRYHDHIIRNSAEKNKIAEYIENNVGRWQEDCFHSSK